MKDILCDVDGVVADLIGGFSDWLVASGLPRLDPTRLTLFDIRRAALTPELVDLDVVLRQRWPGAGPDGGLNAAFMSFMDADSYDWVSPIEGAKEGIADLQTDHNVYFVTAMMDACPAHLPSKVRWMKKHFPTVPVFTAPSRLKQQIRGDIGIDDRYDTCARWSAMGLRTFVFKQAWNEAPDDHPRYDWSNLVEAIRNG
jgi:hypothetical protein